MSRPISETSWPRRAVDLFGALGLIPFWAPLAVALVAPAWAVWALSVQSLYGGLILSFLAGSRFGRALYQPGQTRVVALAMVPPIVGLAVLALPIPGAKGMDHMLIAGALAAVWAWDAFASDLPRPFRALRTILTVLATVALICGGLMLRRLG